LSEPRNTWAKERRLDFIDDVLTEREWINRRDIMDYFRVTVVIASRDLAAFAKLDRYMVYNERTQRYERNAGSVRSSTPARRKAWRLFK